MNFSKVFSIILFLCSSSPILGDNRIMGPDAVLREGQKIDFKQCELFVQRDGNVVVKNDGVVTWSALGGVPESDHDNFRLKMKRDGNLIVRSNKKRFFKTKTSADDLDSDEGGLYFGPDCELMIKRMSQNDVVWSNIRTKLYSGNRLQKGEMFKFPESQPEFVLYLQQDGNLVMFKGTNKSDKPASKDIIFNSKAFTDKDEFFLNIACDGRLVLKHLVSKRPARYETYWEHQLVPRNDLNQDKKGYSITLSKDGLGYELESECKLEDFTA